MLIVNSPTQAIPVKVTNTVPVSLVQPVSVAAPRVAPFQAQIALTGPSTTDLLTGSVTIRGTRRLHIGFVSFTGLMNNAWGTITTVVNGVSVVHWVTGQPLPGIFPIESIGLSTPVSLYADAGSTVTMVSTGGTSVTQSGTEHATISGEFVD